MKKLLVVVALLMIALPAMAQNRAQIYRDSYCTMYWIFCCDEYIEFCVETQNVYKWTYDETTGTYKFMSHFTLKGKGTGFPSGEEYTVKQINNVNDKWDPAALSEVWTNEIRFRITSKSGCSYILKVKVHLVYKNGEIIVDRYDITEECDSGTLE